MLLSVPAPIFTSKLSLDIPRQRVTNICTNLKLWFCHFVQEVVLDPYE